MSLSCHLCCLPTLNPQSRAGRWLSGQSPSLHGEQVQGRKGQRSAPNTEGKARHSSAAADRRLLQATWGGGVWGGAQPGKLGKSHRTVEEGEARRRTQPAEGAGTRGSQAAVGISVLAVLLLLKLGHQAEFPAAAAFGKIHHILCGKGETLRIRPQGTKPRVTPGSERRRGQKVLCSKFTYSCVFL